MSSTSSSAPAAAAQGIEKNYGFVDPPGVDFDEMDGVTGPLRQVWFECKVSKPVLYKLPDFFTRVQPAEIYWAPTKDTKQGADFAVKLAEALPHVPSLTAVIIKDNIGDAGIKALTPALIEFKKMQKLICNGCGIGSEGGRLIGALLAASDLVYLDLSNNELCADGVVPIAAGLSTSTSLETLKLSFCGVDSTAAGALASALKTNTSLHHLDLSENNMEDKTVAEVVKALEVNTSLKELKIRFNKLGPLTVLALAAVLNKNETLEKIVLGSVNIDDAITGETLIEAVKTNTSLREIDIYSRFIGCTIEDFVSKREKARKEAMPIKRKAREMK